MLSSITPLGERARNRSWGTTVGFYVTGAVVGGVALGALAGGVGSLVPPAYRIQGAALAVLLVVLMAGGAIVEIGLVDVSLPTLHRQVNEDWLGRYRGWVVGVGFGAQLGFGVATMITSPATYVMIVTMFLTHSLWLGVTIGAAFGLARALPILATRSVDTASGLRALHVSMSALAPAARRAVASSMTAVAAAIVLVGVVA